MKEKRWELFEYPDIHTHVPKPQAVLSVDVTDKADLEQLHSHNGPFTVGVHPWNAGTPVDWNLLGELLQKPGAVGVGEAGLDYLRGAPINVQMDVFKKQIELSEKLQLPLVIHAVKSYHDILALKKEFMPKSPWVIHGFRGGVQLARQLTDAGLHLSLGTKYNDKVREEIPPTMLHNESDEVPGDIETP